MSANRDTKQTKEKDTEREGEGARANAGIWTLSEPCGGCGLKATVSAGNERRVVCRKRRPFCLRHYVEKSYVLFLCVLLPNTHGFITSLPARITFKLFK